MKIEIPNPCPEKWENMRPVEEGAFCSVCNKTVIDFSRKTREQIRQFFYRKEEGIPVCGRMSGTQLMELNFDGFFARFRLWRLGKRIAVVLFFVFGTGLFSGCGSGHTVGEMEPVGKVAVTDSLSAKMDSVYAFEHGALGTEYKYDADSASVKTVAPEPEVIQVKKEDETKLEVQNEKPGDHPPPLPLAPAYKNGKKEMEKDIAANLKYPEEAKKNKVEGTVFVLFKITAEGKMKDVEVKNKMGHGLDEEAIRVVKLLKDWEPGRRGSKAMEMEIGVPVTFKIAE